MNLSLITRHGVFSTADARTLGLSDNDLVRLVGSGECVRLTRGWYAPISGPLDPVERHRLTALALGREYCGRAALSHYTAVVAQRIATHAVDLSKVHLTLGARRGHVARTIAGPTAGDPRRAGGPKAPGVSARRKGLVLHGPIGGVTYPASEPGPGVWVTPTAVPLAWAVVQTGLVSGGLSALVSADAALHSGQLDVTDLGSAVDRFRRHAGIQHVRAALAWADGRHESPGETRAAYVMRLVGFDVEPQVEVVAEGRTYRADFRIVGTRVLVEFDGAVKYGTDRRVLFEEKRREDALRRQGWVVVRIVWDELEDPHLIRRRIVDAVRLAGEA